MSILAGIIIELDKWILRFIWKCEGSQIAKAILKKNKVGGLRHLYFKTYFKATEIKTHDTDIKLDIHINAKEL